MTATREIFTAYRLASMADCADPDSPDSIGAQFLTGVQDAVAERLDWASENGEDITYPGDVAAEIADGAVPVYTYPLWRTFVDLGAWAEDVTEYGSEDSDTDSRARVALYMIADRLASALLEEWAQDAEQD